MSKVRLIEKNLIEIFDYHRGKRLTVSNRLPGNIPFVTAGYKNNGVAELIGNKGIEKYKNAITIDMFCNCMWQEKTFACDDNILVLINDEILSADTAEYFITQIEKAKEFFGFGYQYRQKDLMKHKISIPVREDNSIDIDAIRMFSMSLSNIKEQRNKILEKLDRINAVSVLIPESKGIVWKDLTLNELFQSISRGKSKYTKTYCKEHHGDYPVYSANNNEPLAYKNDYDYDGRCLTISINGIAGVTTIIDGKFSTTADRVVCVPKENVSIDYIKHIAEPFLRDKSKGRVGDKGKNEFTKLTPDMIKKVKIPMPLNEDGTYNIGIQTEYADKYDLIDRIKEDITTKVKNLLDVAVK